MSVVRINAITVPKDKADELERRFAARAGEVAKSPGFEAFELLRPTDERDEFLVYTRWRSREDLEAWTASQAFDRGHAQASGRPATDGPAATGSTIWSFEIVQSTDPV